jgi:hypothetical protein
MVGSIAFILSAKLLTASFSSAKLRISSADGRVNGFLSKSFSIRVFISIGKVEGTLIALESVI